MSEQGEQAIVGEQGQRYDGGLGVGPAPDSTVRVASLDTEAMAHRRAFGGGPSEDIGHDHEEDEIPPAVRRYLTPAENHATLLHQHPAALALPTLVLAVSLALAITLNALSYEHHDANIFTVRLIWISFMAVVVWYGWKDLQWRVTWYAITPRRIMKVTGFPSRQVVSLPWRRARDLELLQDVAGRLLGYGTLVAPSIGTGHALAQIPYVPQPERVYRMIWAILEPTRGTSPAPEEVE